MKRFAFHYRLFILIAVFGFFSACKKDNDAIPLRADFKTETQELLAGDVVRFEDISQGQPATWNWEFPGGDPATSDLSGPEVRYNEPGTYAVTLTIGNKHTTSTETRQGFIKVGYRQVEAAFTISATAVNQNEPVTFTDNSTGMPTAWAWEFKSGATVLTSTEKSPVITFTEPGVYTVTLKVSNPVGEDTEVKTGVLTIVDLTSVEAAFTSDFRSTYTGGTIQFSDASIGTATAWAWTFEGADATTSTEQNPSVKYSAAGRYKVTLVASNDVRSSAVEKTGYILVVPGNGLTAFYPMDGSVNDAGPSKLPSDARGTIAFTQPDRLGAEAAAALLNGSGGIYVEDDNAMNFGVGDYTVSVWYKTNTTQRGMVWQESGALGSGDSQTWLRILGSGTNLTSFSTEDNTGGSTINLTTANAGAAATTNDGVWHHVVCVRSGAVTALYIDGVKIREATSATGPKTTSNNAGFKIGMQETATGFSNPFNGQIDDLIIYKRALSAAEITALKDL
ncbi:MAG: PKD domain-containing protein [Sphingobacteriales bacterium]|nr:MAG: PKD domain-containing protein [Sphingobacteriales bacterium]